MGSFKINLSKSKAKPQNDDKKAEKFLNCEMIRKLMWSAIFIICSCLILLQVADRIRYYSNIPLSTNIQIIRNQSMQLPHITICPSDYKRPDIENEMRNNLSKILDRKITAYDLILLENNMTQLWNTLSYKLSDSIKACILRGDEPCERNGFWTPFPSIRGNCFKYATDTTLWGTGPYNGLNLVLHDVIPRGPRDPFVWRLLIHSSYDEPLLEAFSGGIFIYNNFFYDIRLKLKKFQLIDTPKNPCGQISMSNCVVTCLKNEILTTVGCSLPFMNSSNNLCNSPEDFEYSDKLIDAWTRSSPNCSCLQECQHDWFETNVDSSPWPTGRNATRIRIFYDSFFYEHSQETYLYSLVAMLCDIGGSMSLFLGVSVLTMLQLVENIIFKIKRKYKTEVK